MSRVEILEGTWEELATHAEKFRGRKLRLMVLSTESGVTRTAEAQSTFSQAAQRLFVEADNTEREPGTPSRDAHKKAFGEIIAEKYRKMGLNV